MRLFSPIMKMEFRLLSPMKQSTHHDLENDSLGTNGFVCMYVCIKRLFSPKLQRTQPCFFSIVMTTVPKQYHLTHWQLNQGTAKSKTTLDC